MTAHNDSTPKTAVADDFIGQRQRRIEKVKKLKEMGIDPYPSSCTKEYPNAEVVDNFEKFENRTVTLAGRLVSYRDHGKIKFANLQDQSGTIQLFFKEDAVQKDVTDGHLGWNQLHLIDIGDIVEVKGQVVKTSTGAISLLVESTRIICKAIRPLPNSIQDKETQFRKRYLDIILTPEHKYRFEVTAKLTFAIREFLNNKGFLEIKTPIIQPVYGGGMAKPFTTNVNALNEDFYLAISHELYLKRLITAGFENVYNIYGYFRNEGIDRSHNPEFTMLETMSAYKNYEYNMQLVEEMYAYITKKVFNKTTFTIQGHTVDFSQPWQRITMKDAIKKYAEIDFDTITTLEAGHALLAENKIEDKPHSLGECMVKIFEEKVEEKLIQPTFVTNHPVEISPLAKRLVSDPRFVERFEIFIGGMEGGDNWTELNDPLDLYERFHQQLEARKRGAEESHPMDIDFVEMMEYGMPPTTGLGPGIERLAMMLTETDYIDDVIFFPMLKPAPLTKIQREIYDIPEEINTVDDSKPSKSKETKVAHVVILNDPTKPEWIKFNTVAHLNASFAAREGKKLIYIEDTTTSDGEKLPMNIQHAIMIKETGDRNQLLQLKREADSAGLTTVVFTEEMLSSTDDKKVKHLQESKPAAGIQFLGILVFGKKMNVEKVTQAFTLMGLSESNIVKNDKGDKKPAIVQKYTGNSISRDEAFKIVDSNIANKNLVKHCIAVEGAMEALAEHFGEDPEVWGMAGLLHDADWEVTGVEKMHEHTLMTVQWIEAAGDVDPVIKRAILAHNFAVNPEPAPETKMEWSLACCDELTGLITASALVLPDRKLDSLKISSIMKKYRNPNFAAAVNRDDISRCEEKLGIPLEQFVEIVLTGMKKKKDLLGL